MAHWYLHVDLDAFFASVEQLDNPELRGKPVIVGGKPEDRRSVVSTASYEARKFGVHSAMPTFQAYKLCPQGIFVHGRMHRYAELSHQIMTIFRDYSPDVDQMSIDEAFIDLTGTEKLFGQPEDTAKAIKKRVKDETGLTVSVGLASTKYLAKIASGLSKPDGFYHIKEGSEESFMLNLPLNKVWGLGPKSLELIRSKGLTSTRDIYEKDYDTLEFLFGKNMAGFLYNVVRGIEKESFSRETKSHSISAETTFPYDLTDIYTIETELLELAHGVFFRLLKEESFSRTAFVKIRYDDFSTCTVQETLERNIITLDSYFEIIKKLFEKRYQNGRGIRLLGVGFENIVKEEKPYQQDLFSINNDEKKQAVEKAILKLSKKHPEIKVSKARTLKALLFALLLGSFSGKLRAEAPVSLFDYDINDKNHVDFSASGLWKAEFTAGLDMTFGHGTDFAISPSLPVFKQETDISALLTLNKSWYFEAAFADEFTRNTLAFGYNGNGIIRNFRLANRGITMPEGYSAEHFGYSLRGGNNQAPGMSLHLVSPSEKVQSDFLVRYDMTETKSEIYYGMNKVSDLTISAENFVYGREFNFPETAAQNLYEIKNVYIEDKAGSYTDSRNRSYRKLRNDEYTLAKNRLYLSQEAGGGKNSDGDIPSILLTFNFASSPAAIISQCGSWDDSQSFFGKIQKELGSGNKYQIKDFVYEMLTDIEGESALIIQNFKGFSPFMTASIYDCGTAKEAEYLVISKKSEVPVTKYKASELDDTYTNLFENYFKSDIKSIKVNNKESLNNIFPFAEDCPEIYLNLQQNTSLAIRARTFSPVKEIILSKKAAAGTVQVYKNGILLTGTVYDENTGILQLNTSVSDTDQLLITWQEENTDFSSGALTAAVGVKIDFLPELSADFSLTTRQPVNQKDLYLEYGIQKNSYTAFSGGIKYEKKGLTLTDKTAISLLNDNTADGLLLYSWQNLFDDWKKELESNPKSKTLEPQKNSSISFSPQDFSSYKEISVDFEISENAQLNSGTFLSGDLSFIFDEDTGTSEAGSEALYLYIQKVQTLKLAKGKHNLSIKTKENIVKLDGSSLPEDCYKLKINSDIIPSRLTIESSEDKSLSISAGSLSEESKKVLIEKITYNEANYYGTLKNYFSADYKNDKLHLALESDQGSGNFAKPSPFVTAKALGDVNLNVISLSADLAMQNLTESPVVSEAGHSIKTDKNFLFFKILSAEDSYRYKKTADELRKNNAFSLDFSPVKIPFITSLKTSAYSTQFHGKQDSTISASYTQKIFEGDAAFSAKLNLSQKLLNSQKESVSPSYAKSWMDISSLEFSDGKEYAAERNTLWSFILNGTAPLNNNLLTIKPKLTYELSDKYLLSDDTEASYSKFSDKEFLSLLLPFTSEKKFISFEIARTGGGTKAAGYGGNYKKDTQELYNLQNERKWFYSSLPFYELFDSDLSEKVSQSYAAKYEGNFRRTLYNSKKDLFVPSAMTLAVTREINKQPPIADLYQIKTVITNNSINNFGSRSKDQHFSWFTQEELTTRLSAIVKIPAAEPENFKINIQTFAQLILFISEKSILTEQFNFAIEDSANWDLHNTISYSRPSQTSLLTYLTNLIFPSTKNSDFSISRKDSFTAGLEREEAVFQQKYSYNHNVEINFLEYYSVNAGLEGSLILNQKLADRINLSFTIGAKAEF